MPVLMSRLELLYQSIVSPTTPIQGRVGIIEQFTLFDLETLPHGKKLTSIYLLFEQNLSYTVSICYQEIE